ncbi:MAG: lipopolysaccharide biosynthesis protein [Pseudomonadota bacterium]|nr:lipopolysaccharide biosynthesis protein [Pseudomonadota bacterium]
MQDIKARLTRASLWITATRGFANIVTAVSTVVAARLLVPADFGLVAIAASIIAVLAAIAESSTSSAIIQLKEPTEDHYHTAWTLGLARGAALALFVAAIAHPVSLLYREPRLESVMYALAASPLILGLVNPRIFLLQKQLIFRQVFFINLSQTIVSVVVSISFAVLFRNYWALVAGTLSGQLANVLASYLLFPFRPRPGWKHVRELWGFSIWLSLGQVITTVNLRFDQLLIGGFLGRTTLGHYSVGENLAVIPTREAVHPLFQTLFPAYSLISGDPLRLRGAFQRTQTLLTAISLPAGVGFALIADPFVRLTMGAKWAPAIIVIQVISCLYAAQSIGRLANPLAMAKNATRLLFKRSVQLFCIRVPLIATGMFLGGLPGVLIGRAIFGTTAIIVNLRMIRSLIDLPIRDQLGANLRPIASVLLMTATVSGVKALRPAPFAAIDSIVTILLALVVGAATYFGTMLLLWTAQGRPSGPETEAIALLRQLARRLTGSSVAEQAREKPE